MRTFQCFQSIYNTGEKEIFHSGSIPHTHMLYVQEYSKRDKYYKEDYGYLQIPCAGSLFIPFTTPFFNI